MMDNDQKNFGGDRYPRIDLEKTHWIDIFTEFMLKNQPFILKRSATKSWMSRELWIKKDLAGMTSTPNYEYIIEKYG